MVWSTFWRSRKFLTNLPKLSCGFNLGYLILLSNIRIKGHMPGRMMWKHRYMHWVFVPDRRGLMFVPDRRAWMITSFLYCQFTIFMSKSLKFHFSHDFLVNYHIMLLFIHCWFGFKIWEFCHLRLSAGPQRPLGHAQVFTSFTPFCRALNPFNTRPHQNVVWYNNSWLGFSKNSELCTKRKGKIFCKNWALICRN